MTSLLNAISMKWLIPLVCQLMRLLMRLLSKNGSHPSASGKNDLHERRFGFTIIISFSTGVLANGNRKWSHLPVTPGGRKHLKSLRNGSPADQATSSEDRSENPQTPE